jgi:putative ABC transport system permease protein
VAVLTHELWMRSFGGDPALVGRSIHMNERPTIVVGILPPRFQFFYPDAQVWMPIQFDTRTWARRDLRYLHVVGRLRDNVTVRQAQSELDVLSQSLRAAAPVANLNFKAVAIDLRTDLTGSARTRVLLLAACAALVFGIACINVVHLILSRSVRRASDLAVRLSLGATRARLMRQLFTEGFALSTVAGLSGLALAWWSLPFLTFLVPEAMAVYTTLQPSPGTGLVALLLSLSAAALCGIVPAVRLAGMNWHDTIKHGSTRVVGGFGHERLRGLLVMSEVALAVLLVVGASLLMRTLLEVLHVDAGFSPENVLTAVTTPPRDLRSFEVRTVFIDSAVARLRSIPGVANVAFMSAVPFTWKGGKLEFAVEGQVPQPEQAALNRQVTPEYFRTLRIPLRAGREFSDDDRASTQRVGIVNEALVRSYLAGGTAIGRRIRVRGPGFDATPITIVGVAADVKEMGLLQPALPMIYLPHSQTRATFNVPFQVAVRTTGDPAAAAPSLRRQLAEGWPGMPVTKVRTLEAIFEKEMADRRPMALLAAGLAAVALLLACIGIHGLLAFAVAQRLPEIGIRHALGAPPVRLLCDVLGQGVALSLAGVVLGLAVSAVLVTTIRGVLYGVSPVDPVTFAAAPVLVLAIACSAAFFPARAALKTDPARALRAE